MEIAIGTFNCENLFRRFRFKDCTTGEAQLAIEGNDGFSLDKDLLEPTMPKSREITAQAVRGINADILALQEVENLDTLRLFNTQFIKNGYKFQLVIDGNDPRAIDVAVLSRYPFGNIRTHQFDKKSPQSLSRIFSRDCLEVDILLPGSKTLTLFVNHLKSMVGGRPQTMDRRKEQSARVVDIILERFGSDPGKAPFVVLGDFNDYYDEPNQPSPGLSPLLSKPWVEDAVSRLPLAERWTHYYDKGSEYKQLDYILLSKSLATANPGVVPKIERRGLPKRATNVAGPRFPEVGQNEPKASDHCPVVISIAI